jgi:hypothetical protein
MLVPMVVPVRALAARQFSAPRLALTLRSGERAIAHAWTCGRRTVAPTPLIDEQSAGRAMRQLGNGLTLNVGRAKDVLGISPAEVVDPPVQRAALAKQLTMLVP